MRHALGTGGNAQSFSSWVTEWKSTFTGYWSTSFSSAQNVTGSSSTNYTIPVNASYLAMSACDAKLSSPGSGVGVAVSYYNAGTSSWIPVTAASLDDFEAINFWTSSVLSHRLTVNHVGSETPKTYVAYGYGAGP